MHRINKVCPHCGSNMVFASREYKWQCRKCCRYELNPIEIADPLRAELYGRQVGNEAMEIRYCEFPKCGSEFEAQENSRRKFCPKHNSVMVTRNRAKRRKEEKAKIEKAA